MLQLTLVNTDYLRAVTSSGDEWRLSAFYLPSVIRSTLRNLIRLVGDVTSAMSLLAGADCDAVDRWRVQLDYPPGFRCLGFSAWLANNDTVEKDDVMSELAGRLQNVSEVAAIYAALTGCSDLLTNISCLYLDDNSTFSTTPTSDFIRALFEVRSGNVSSVNVTTTNVLAAALCSNAVDGHPCFAIPPNQRVATTYLRVLSVYVITHLGTYAFHRAFYIPGNDLVVMRSQSRLAVGDGQGVPGILEHYVDAVSAPNSSQLVTIYNCYDAIYAVSNGHWECK